MRFKLIKIYPGSPAMGTIIHEVIPGTFVSGDGGITLPKAEVISYPEFWEKLGTQPAYTIGTNCLTRICDKAYFSKGQRIRTPVSKSPCFIYGIREEHGVAVCDNTHSYLLEKAGMDWLTVSEPCVFSKMDMLEFGGMVASLRNHGSTVEGLYEKFLRDQDCQG